MLVISLVFSFKTAAFEYSADDFDSAHPNRLIVKFKPRVDSSRIERLNTELGTKIETRLLFDDTFTIKIPEKRQGQFIKLFSRSPLVEYAEPDYKVEAFEVPNDSDFKKQWGMTKIQAPEAWDLTHSIPQVKIAILDTGIDRDHPDLASKVEKWVNFTSDQSSDDGYGHGTHVAGIASALTNNNLGVAGLGWESRLLSVKVLNDNGSGYHSWIANGLRWAADNNAKVINLSLGGSRGSKTLEQAVKYAWKKDVVLVCAARNSGSKSRTYPAYYQNCIATAAINQDDQKSSWSNYGAWVDVAAPGDKIYSTFPNHSNKMGAKDYGYGSGTSMAAPYVAGLAALLFGSDETLTNSQVREMIEENADQISGTGRYWNHGRINAYHSVLGLGSVSAPILMPTSMLTPTPTLTPIPTNTPTPTIRPTPTPQEKESWWCRRVPWLCD